MLQSIYNSVTGYRTPNKYNSQFVKSGYGRKDRLSDA